MGGRAPSRRVVIFVLLGAAYFLCQFFRSANAVIAPDLSRGTLARCGATWADDQPLLRRLLRRAAAAGCGARPVRSPGGHSQPHVGRRGRQPALRRGPQFRGSGAGPGSDRHGHGRRLHGFAQDLQPVVRHPGLRHGFVVPGGAGGGGRSGGGHSPRLGFPDGRVAGRVPLGRCRRDPECGLHLSCGFGMLRPGSNGRAATRRVVCGASSVPPCSGASPFWTWPSWATCCPSRGCGEVPSCTTCSACRACRWATTCSRCPAPRWSATLPADGSRGARALPGFW